MLNIFRENIKNFQPDVEIIEENFENYISDSKVIVKLLEELLDSKGHYLIEALPGKGKTTLLMELASYVDGGVAFLEPTRMLVCQVYKDNKDTRDIVRVLGKNSQTEIEIPKATIYSSSFECLPSLVSKKLVKVAIVDEAHNEICARYRNFKEVEECLDNMDTVLYVTATPTPLLSKKIDKYINLQPKNLSMFASELEITNYSGDVNGAIKKLIEDNSRDGKRTFIRFNNKDFTNNICKATSIKTHRISSEAKSFEEIDDETIFKNHMMNEIVNYSLLPTCDSAFTTSICDQGISIRGWEDNFSLDDTNVVFVVESPRDLNIDYLLQFKDRIRRSFGKFTILMKEEDREPYKIIPFYEFYNIYCEDMINSKECLEKWINNRRKEGLTNQQIKLMWIDDKNNKSVITSIPNDFGGLLSLNDNCEIVIDEKNLIMNSLEEYYSRFYHNHEELKKFFVKDFKQDVLIEGYDKIEINHEENVKQAKEALTKIENIERGFKLLDDNNEEILTKEAQSLKDKVYEISKLEGSLERAAMLVVDKEEKELKSYVEDRVNEELNKLDSNELRLEIEKMVNKQLSPIISKIRLNEELKDFLITIYNKNYSIDELVGKFGEIDYDEYLQEQRISQLLEMNSRGYREELRDSKDLYFIIDYLGKAYINQHICLYTIEGGKVKLDNNSKKVEDLWNSIKEIKSNKLTKKKLIKLIERLYNIKEEVVVENVQTTTKSGKIKIKEVEIKKVYLNGLKNY